MNKKAILAKYTRLQFKDAVAADRYHLLTNHIQLYGVETCSCSSYFLRLAKATSCKQYKEFLGSHGVSVLAKLFL